MGSSKDVCSKGERGVGSDSDKGEWFDYMWTSTTRYCTACHAGVHLRGVSYHPYSDGSGCTKVDHSDCWMSAVCGSVVCGMEPMHQLYVSATSHPSLASHWPWICKHCAAYFQSQAAIKKHLSVHKQPCNQPVEEDKPTEAMEIIASDTLARHRSNLLLCLMLTTDCL